ncbi:hypothetical protein MBENS4_2670 [Novosphingobium sp. MBES04]|nr:hypothetical protein MBENS4_2670 [Novosphingobium sp. MBES04]
MDVQHFSTFDWDDGVDDYTPEDLLPPLDGPQETDDCESEVASDRYSYGGLMKMGRSERSGGRPRKKPLLMLDDSERRDALRELDMVAVQDFGEAIPMERPVRMQGLTPAEAVDSASLNTPVPEAPAPQAPEPAAYMPAAPIPAEPMASESMPSEFMDAPASASPTPRFGALGGEGSVLGRDPFPAAFEDAAFEDEGEDEDEQGLDEAAYGSLFGKAAPSAQPAPTPVPTPAPAPEPVAARPAPMPEPAPAPLAPALVEAEPAPVFAPQVEAVFAPQVESEPAPVRSASGHALRARMQAEEVSAPESESLLARIGRFFAWLGSLLRR